MNEIESAKHCCDQIRTPAGIAGAIRAGIEAAERENAALIRRVIRGLKRIGSFRYESGDEPHSLDCTLAGRVSHIFGCGMTRAIELCREAGENPEFDEARENAKEAGK